MGVSSLPKTVTRQRRDCDLNPGPSAPESSTLTTRLPSHAIFEGVNWALLLSLRRDGCDGECGPCRVVESRVSAGVERHGKATSSISWHRPTSRRLIVRLRLR